MKNQNYGIEMTGITREAAAKALAAYFETTAKYLGTSYGTWGIKDPEGKTWKLMSDASISTERKVGKGKYELIGDKNYSVELVSSILQYNQIPKLQEVVRQLHHAGAKVNGGCGIHIHVGAESHLVKTLRDVLGIMYAKEDLLSKALQVRESRVYYCKKSREDVLMAARKDKNLTMDKLERIWYGSEYSTRKQHYNDSRYHALNLHATFTKGTIEFRLFNAALQYPFI